MIRVMKIGSITLEHSLFLLESYKSKNVTAVTYKTLSNSTIVYESSRRNPSITLDSKENGWLSEDTLNKIVALSDDLDVITTITTTENTVKQVRFKHEMPNGFMEYEQIFEGSNFYRVKIFLEEC